MKTALYSYSHGSWKKHLKSKDVDENRAQLVFCFSSKAILAGNDSYALLRGKFPSATIAMCSTSGEILDTEVRDDSISVAALQFTSTIVVAHSVHIADSANSHDAGVELIRKFDREGLSSVFVLSDGSQVNGSELVQGMNTAGNGILITGGLAGDGSNFQSTLVGINGDAEEGLIVGIGFYGDKLRVGHGSQGGWETFGLERVVNRSDKNVLYEMDGKNALELYKRYLGPDADNLPGSALMFPLAVKLPGVSDPVVRTILSIDETAGSMTFAGNIPEGSQVRFMRANFDKLTTAASAAATQSLRGNDKPGFALLVSCVGRKLVLDTRTEEEVEAVADIFGGDTLLSGFYSYGEISPLNPPAGGCQLHNQTMTITTFNEME